MRAWLALLFVGCGFSPSGSSVSGGNDGDGGVSDAIHDAKLFLDAPIDGPCDDEDHDGICNAVDTWPCGVMPADLGATLQMTGNGTQTKFALSMIDVAASGRMVVAAPNQTVAVKLHLVITDTACSQSCVDQLELGWAAPGNRTSCIFDGSVPDPGGIDANVQGTVKTPATPGVYDIRVNIGQNYFCTANGANSWWGAAPGENRTLAKVCVH